MALRQALAQNLTRHNSTECCWRLSQHTDSPSCAFFIGYQTALRHLNPQLSPTTWAAFVASERGIYNPFDYQTQYSPDTQTLQGHKSHIPLLGQGMDELYILATLADTHPVELVLIKVDASAVCHQEQVQQSFLQQVPHFQAAIHCQVSAKNLLFDNAHQRANKPFRYWEDIHITLALAAWFSANIQEPSAQEALHQAAHTLEHHFWQQPYYYILPTLDACEHLIHLMDKHTKQLPDSLQQQWQIDAHLFKLLTPLKQRIRRTLTS